MPRTDVLMGRKTKAGEPSTVSLVLLVNSKMAFSLFDRSDLNKKKKCQEARRVVSLGVAGVSQLNGLVECSFFVMTGCTLVRYIFTIFPKSDQIHFLGLVNKAHVTMYTDIFTL